MNAERWWRIEQLFHEASALAPDRQDAWLLEKCAGDQELHREVTRLLAADRQSATGVRRVIEDASNDLLVDGMNPQGFRDARVGAWRLGGLLGAGGMGLVFLAHRDDGRFEQTAAIKLLRFTLATPADLARFRRERRILARLEHPHIARLLDAGEHPVGNGLEIPYYVMEHVAGQPLTTYANEHALTTRARVELYLQVLDAVGYAHQRFVLHRDLKPANILVTAEGVAKLLDFGIAQLLEGDPASFPQDRTRSSLMTPDYASPEQLRGDLLTAQSDVFTLGALLYELLSNRRAYETSTPSADDRVASMTTNPPAPLNIDSDLDTIVAKAIHLDLERRYASVEAFAADVRRYLAGRPVAARKDSVWYRGRKFAVRHRWPLAATAVIVLSLAAGVVTTAYEARRANQHLAQLRQLSGRLLFQIHDAVQSLQGATKARELLVTTSAEYLDGLNASAGSDPAFLNDLGEAYERLGRVFGGPNGGHLGRPNDAIATFKKAVDAFERLERVSPDVNKARVLQARVWGAMGRVQALSGDAETAERSLERSYKLGRDATPAGQPLPPEVVDALLYRGDLLFDRGKPRDALRYYEQALPEVERRAAAEPDVVRQRALSNMRIRIGQTQVFLGNLTGGRDAFRQALDRALVVARDNPNNASAQRDVFLITDRLGTVTGHPDHPNLGDAAAATALYEAAVDQSASIAAADPQNVRALRDAGEIRAQLAGTLRERDPARARAEYTRALAIYASLPESMRKTPSIERWIANHERGLAISLAGLSRTDAALAQLERSLATFERLAMPQDIGVTFTDIARLRAKAGQTAAAQAAVTRAISTLEAARRETPDDISLRRDLAVAYTVSAMIVGPGQGCGAVREWLQKAEMLWRGLGGTEAASYGESELKKLSAIHCG